MDKNNDIVYFAKTNFRGQEKIFGIKLKDRMQHIYVIGQTGCGKTNLLRNLAIQDIQQGRGLAVIDPHGEFVEELLDSIPPYRVDDVVYFNPADVNYPIGFNVLEVTNPDNKNLVSSGLMSIFTKIWSNVWSARMEYILNNCVLALLDTPGSTLLGIPRLLVDKNYRQKIVNNVTDPVIKSFWINEYEQWQDRFRNEAIAPVQNKVGQFLSTGLIRNIVGQPKSTLNIEELMDQQKILLVNVSKGRIGEDNSALLGAMLVTKIQLTAMERIKVPIEERNPFFLYVDEFQNFATDAFASILSEARKYGLSLVISHQYIGQLVTETSTRVKDGIFGNVGTTVIFRVGASDAEFLEKQLAPEITAQDLVNLPNWNIYLKLMVDGVSTRPFSAVTLPPIPIPKEKGVRERIIEASRKNYSTPRKKVEKMIAEWSGTAEMAYTQKEFKGRHRARSENIARRVMPLEKAKKYDTNLEELGIGTGEEAEKRSRRGSRENGEKIKRDFKKQLDAKSFFVKPKVLKPKEKPLTLDQLAERINKPETFKKKSAKPDLGGLKEALEKALDKE